jgi:hypothetical protein
MINLRKPFEGVPGLLLLAALVLFGVTIGVSLALMCHWVTMQAEVANFLGGVVGAGLGAALAVMGAVYVQQKEARDKLTGTIHAALDRLRSIQAASSALLGFVPSFDPSSAETREFVRAIVKKLVKDAREFPPYFDLPYLITLQIRNLILSSESLELAASRIKGSHDNAAIDRLANELAELFDDANEAIIRLQELADL